MNNNGHIIKAEGITKDYKDHNIIVNALRGIDFTIAAGEFTAIVGPSGSGKTTLLNIISGLDTPTEGKVWLKGMEISHMSGNELSDCRRDNIGFIFQAYNLIPVLTVKENIEYVMLLQGVDKEERHDRVLKILEELDLAGFHDRFPPQLSGGQQQRVAIARAMVSTPSLYLCAGDFKLKGYYKSFFTGYFLPDYKIWDTTVNPSAIASFSNRLNLKLNYKISNNAFFDASYNLIPLVQDHALFEEDIIFSSSDLPEYRFADIRNRLHPSENYEVESFAAYNNLDRFMLTVDAGFADIFVGRQAISWGSAHVINPTDIIAPFAFYELDAEEIRGVDAVRVRIPMGMMNEIDFGYVAGKDCDIKKSALFLRSKFYVRQTDVSFMVMDFRQHLMLGFDITRALRSAGSWIEAAYVIPYAFEKETATKEDNYFRLSAGVDYNFNSKTYGFAEYHFNSAGEKEPEQYGNEFSRSAFRDGAVYLLGRHYFNLGITYQLTPLMPLTGLLIFNANDKSLMTSISAEYNIAENIYLAIGAYIGLGKNREKFPALNPFQGYITIFHSEFGAYPNIIYTSFKLYF